MKRSSTIILLMATVCCTLIGCYSNNCPMENTVLCNYYFYDAEGTPIKYMESITVKTLMPGWKPLYTYKKLGNLTVTKDYIDQELIDEGYTMTESTQRNDTILLNNKSDATYMSLPMSYFNNADTLVLSYSGISQKDTIIVEQDSYPHVELPECGTYRYHTLKSIKATDAAIDHIEISHPVVNYDGNENVKIYFNGVVN